MSNHVVISGCSSQSYCQAKQLNQPFTEESDCRCPCPKQSCLRQATLFKCQHPITKSMETSKARIETYLKNWPRHIKASPRYLTEAGFFYLGDRDRVKCFYCNGGLQNWHYNDDPWFEHAKWYPECEYVLKMKGIEYVQQVAGHFPNLQRPNLTGTEAGRNTQQQHYQQQEPNKHSNSSYDTSNTCVVVADEPIPAKCSSADAAGCSIKAKIQDEMRTEIVKEALNFGFQIYLVEKLLQRKLSTGKKPYHSVQELVSDLQQFETEEEQLHEPMDTDNASTFPETARMGKVSTDDLPGNYSPFAAQEARNRIGVSSQGLFSSPAPSNVAIAPVASGSKKLVYKKSPNENLESSAANLKIEEDNKLSFKAELEQIKQEQMCKVCLDKNSNCVFIPCGHICCCSDCASALRTCPICRAKIDKIWLFYRQ